MIEYKDQQVKPSNYAIIRWFGFDKFVPEQAVTSYWVSPKALFIIRLLLALYTTIVFWTFLALTAVFSDLRRFFSAFTTMTFIGLHGYLITASVHLFRYLRHKNVDFLLNQAPVWNYLYMYLYSTIITFNILTPAVFWSILNTEAFWVRFTTEVGQVPPIIIMWINVSVHGVTFFIMFIDVIFNRMKIPIRLVLLVFFTVVSYMCLAFIIFATNGRWVYPFLDWSKGPSAAIWYIAVAGIVVVGFLVMVFLHWFRDVLARKVGKANVCPVCPMPHETKYTLASQV